MKQVLVLLVALVATAAAGSAKADTNPDYLSIRPSYRKDSQLPVKPGHNPFRRALPTEERPMAAADNNSVATQILIALGSSPVNGLLEATNGVPTVVIAGEAYTLNDEIRLAGNKPVLEGYSVLVRSITRREIGLEAYSKTAKTATAVPLVISLDDFFDEK